MFLTLFKTGRGGDRYYTLHDLQRDLFSKYTLVIYSGIVGKKGNEKNCVILNPHWATEAVYLILFDEKVIDQAGEFDVSDIERIWNDPKYKYKHADLLELMIKFELCYELEKNKKYIVPELLADKVPEKGYPEGFKDPGKTKILHFEYRYNFMPKGIISRLIVRMNEYIYEKL